MQVLTRYTLNLKEFERKDASSLYTCIEMYNTPSIFVKLLLSDIVH